jgi:hypothetical protein
VFAAGDVVAFAGATAITADVDADDGTADFAANAAGSSAFCG